MNNKFIYIGIFFIIAVIGILAYSYFNNSSTTNPTNDECYDCGEGGWELMDTKCNTKILSKEDAIMCLSKFEWSNVKPDTNTNEIKEGYIKVHGYGILEDEKNSIKVYNYHQWAIDENGNMYLEGQLG